MWDNLLTLGLFVLIGWAVLRGGGGRTPRIWSGDTPAEAARRNTRTASNYRGHDHWNNHSGRGCSGVTTLAINARKGRAGRNPRIWSGDTPDEEARRNTRTDSNYRGYDHWNNNSDRGW